MVIGAIGLGKPSDHVIAKTKHQRGVFGLYAVPVFYERDAMNINESSVANFVREEWLVTTGFVHIDFSIKMVYIGTDDNVVMMPYDSVIDWQKALSRVVHHNIDVAYAVSIERLK
jgi:hypothetical protein